MDESLLRAAFSRVKADIQSVRSLLEELKSQILAKETQNKALEHEIHQLKAIITQNQAKNQDFFLFSTGNKGVFRQTDNRQTTDFRQITNISPQIYPPPPQIITSQQAIESIFISLTEKEFLLFLTLYQLEEELKSPISYPQLANKLKISQSSVRDHLSELLRKQAPLIKLKFNNKKVLLSVDKTFKSLNLMGRIINSRHFQDTQTTLHEI